MKNTYIHTYILACLICGTVVNSQSYQQLDKQPIFINYTSQRITQEKLQQIPLGLSRALVDSRYIDINLSGLNIINSNDGKYHNIKNKQIAGHEIIVNLPGIVDGLILYVDNVQNLIEGQEVVTYTGSVNGKNKDFFSLQMMFGFRVYM